MRDFLAGIGTLATALRLLAAPGLRTFVWGPILINGVVFVGLFVLGYAWLQDLLASWLPTPSAGDSEGWLGWLYDAIRQLALWLLLPLYLMASAVIAFFSFTAVANLIAAPFNGMLAARVEARLTGSIPQEVRARGMVVEVIGALGDELRKLGYFALWLLPLLVISLIPVVNLVAGPLWLAVGVWLVTLEYMDYPLGNHGLAFRDQRRWLRAQPAYPAGMGAAVLVMTLIPVLNLIAMPTGVIAATLVQVRRPPQPPSLTRSP